MLEIRCTHTDDNAQQCGRFLARLSGGTLEIYCAKCQSWHAVAVVDLVKQSIAEIPPNGRVRDVKLFL